MGVVSDLRRFATDLRRFTQNLSRNGLSPAPAPALALALAQSSSSASVSGRHDRTATRGALRQESRPDGVTKRHVDGKQGVAVMRLAYSLAHVCRFNASDPSSDYGHATRGVFVANRLKTRNAISGGQI